MFATVQFIVRDLIGELLYWPVWWYTRGLFNVLKFWAREIKDQEQRLGLRIWVKNIFTPMFGQYDWEGRLISFFMRVIQIIVRSIALFIWSVMVSFFVVLWVTLPLIVMYELYANAVALLL